MHNENYKCGGEKPRKTLISFVHVFEFNKLSFFEQKSEALLHSTYFKMMYQTWKLLERCYYILIYYTGMYGAGTWVLRGPIIQYSKISLESFINCKISFHFKCLA